MKLLIEFVVFYLIFIDKNCLAKYGLFATQKQNDTNKEDYSDPNKPQCHTSQIEYRLTKLEVQTAERGESLKSELRENNRRLQALEWQTAEVETALENLKSELSRFSNPGQPLSQSINVDSKSSEDLEKLEEKLQDLSRGLNVAIAAVKLTNLDIKSLKQDVLDIKNSTTKILIDNHQLLNKEFFNDALVEVKHRLNVRHVSNQKCSTSSTDNKPKDCIDLQKLGKKSGVYKIYPDEYPQGFMVLCEMDVFGGGWTVIHNRYEGSQNFYLGWHDYKIGFGNLGGEFWLGLDNIYYLTGHEINELYVELEDHTSTRKYAHYGAFSIGSEMEGYTLKVLSDYHGDGGDSLTYHAGSRFSTKDLDQDGWEEGSCAQSHDGAWWYKGCDTSNLNGKYLNGELPDNFAYKGMYWGEFRGSQYSLRKARMMVRPRDKAIPEETD